MFDHRVLFLSVVAVLAGCSRAPAASTSRAPAARTTGSSDTVAAAEGRRESDDRRAADEREERRLADEREERRLADERRDRDEPGAMDQSNDPVDIEITRAIRAAVVTDGSLSLAARNVVIVTIDSVVTLRGDVETEVERRAVAAHARGAPGVRRVDDLMSVVP